MAKNGTGKEAKKGVDVHGWGPWEDGHPIFDYTENKRREKIMAEERKRKRMKKKKTPPLGVPEIDKRVDALADELLAAGISPKQFITRYIFKWLESSKHVLGENWSDRAKKRMDAIMAFVIDDLE